MWSYPPLKWTKNVLEWRLNVWSASLINPWSVSCALDTLLLIWWWKVTQCCSCCACKCSNLSTKNAHRYCEWGMLLKRSDVVCRMPARANQPSPLLTTWQLAQNFIVRQHLRKIHRIPWFNHCNTVKFSESRACSLNQRPLFDKALSRTTKTMLEL